MSSQKKIQPNQQAAIDALKAFAHLIRQTSECYRNREAAQVKLAWWQQEVTHLEQGEHPLSAQLHQACETFDLSPDALAAIIEAAQLSLVTERFETQAELNQHYQHTGGIVTHLMAQVLSGADQTDALGQYAHHLGISLELTRHIIYFADFFSRGHLYLPTQALAAHHIDYAELMNLPRDKQQTLLKPALAEQAELAQNLHQKALDHLPNTQWAAQYPLRLQAHLALQHLKAIKKDHFSVLTHRVIPGKWRTAWQTYRFTS